MDTAKRSPAPVTAKPKTRTTTPRAKTPEALPRQRSRAAAKPAVSTEAVAMRAYELYVARDGQPGDPMADWLQAEQELTASPAPRQRRATRA